MELAGFKDKYFYQEETVKAYESETEQLKLEISEIMARAKMQIDVRHDIE